MHCQLYVFVNRLHSCLGLCSTNMQSRYIMKVVKRLPNDASQDAGTFFLMLECGQCCLGGYSYLCEHLLQQMGDDSIIESMFCGLCFSEMRWETWSMLLVVHACQLFRLYKCYH